jgi:2',3'-cyclic-nucleotide 2'-phosphodiesterase (5'-nucleotidase family)
MRIIAWLLSTAILFLGMPFHNEVAEGSNATIEVQILAVNDFHGNLEPPTGSSGRIGSINAGGVEFLNTHLNQIRARLLFLLAT